MLRAVGPSLGRPLLPWDIAEVRPDRLLAEIVSTAKQAHGRSSTPTLGVNRHAQPWSDRPRDSASPAMRAVGAILRIINQLDGRRRRNQARASVICSPIAMFLCTGSSLLTTIGPDWSMILPSVSARSNSRVFINRCRSANIASNGANAGNSRASHTTHGKSLRSSFRQRWPRTVPSCHSTKSGSDDFGSPRATASSHCPGPCAICSTRSI